ncbi:ROK family transcriptional regulator [Rhodobacteraceae bacterium CCMM004]|nr:ROK family transcriptional regulator [Rhodobacteraceae bacterium CCMM004]
MAAAENRLESQSGDAGTGVGPLHLSTAAPALPLRQVVFEAVRAKGRAARSELARGLNVSPASVSAVTNDLIGAGYLAETRAALRDADTGRGRPPVALCVRADAGHVAGIKIAQTGHTAVVHDFAGREVASVTVPGDGPRLDGAAAAGRVETLLREVLRRADLPTEALLAVGVGLPGFIDSAAGTVLWSPLLDERNLRFAADIAGRVGLPVVIDNDANLLTLAELWFGSGRAVSNFAVVTIEHGVGMGLVIDNRLYRGARGLGTELGHMKVHLDGALCQCGQRGCLEAYVSDYALLREAGTALAWQGANADPAVVLESLYAHAKAGNEAARSIFRRAGRYLAVGLGNVINLFDPELVLISGARMRYDYLYADEVLAEMRRMAILVDRPAPRVEAHVWGDLIWARGAAALALSQTTTDRLGAGGLVAAQ